MPRLLVVHHSPTPLLRSITDAVLTGARDEEIEGVEVVVRPAPDVLVLRRDGERLVVRPSGTEPKLKAYLEVVEPPDDDVPAARARAAARMTALRDEVAGLWPGS